MSRGNKSYRIITLGDLDVGKSSLIETYLRGQFPRHGGTSTWGARAPEIKMLQRGTKLLELEIFDTGGQEAYNSLTDSYYRGVDGCMLCFDVSNEQSFSHCGKWLGALRYHTRDSEQVAVMLVGLKSDLRQQNKFTSGITPKSEEECRQFAANENLRYIEVSACTNRNVDEVFSQLVEEIDAKRKEFRKADFRNDSFQITSSHKDNKQAKPKSKCCLVN